MKQVTLRRRPAGSVRPEDFALEEAPMPLAGTGEILRSEERRVGKECVP